MIADHPEAAAEPHVRRVEATATEPEILPGSPLPRLAALGVVVTLAANGYDLRTDPGVSTTRHKPAAFALLVAEQDALRAELIGFPLRACSECAAGFRSVSPRRFCSGRCRERHAEGAARA